MECNTRNTLKAGVILLLVVAGQGSPAAAQSSGTFTATGNMTTARSSHTATLLHNGKVLIAGGESLTTLMNSASPLATAELYDPKTGTFSPTGDMTTARRRHTATLLADGKVLITGGSGSGSEELYDPSTGIFAGTGKMVTPRVSHTATLLHDGRVLISGGFGGGASPANAELYDPSTGMFTADGAYAGPNTCDFCAPAVLLADGKVLFTPPAQLFDPGGGAFSVTGPLIYSSHSTATLLTDGKVLFAGGESDEVGRSASAELYDPETGTFTSTGAMASSRVWQAVTLLPNGRALVTGGEGDGCTGTFCQFIGSLDSAELYDATRGTFTPTSDMTARREVHTATLLNDGRVLIAGGLAYGGIGIFFGSLATAELYEPAMLQPAPVLLTISGGGQSQGAILHADTHQVVSASKPAIAGEYLEIYGTGLPEASVIPPQLAIGGRLAEILYFGKAPGFAGLNQVNVRVPQTVAAGPTVPVRLTFSGRTSNEVTMAVQ
jgi:Galactose oxidase, central domain